MSSDNWFMKQLIRQVTRMFVGADGGDVYRTTTMLPEGYNKIWETIVEVEQLDVRLSVDIAAIDRNLGDSSAPVTITLSDGELLEFDYLVYTAAHAHAHKIVGDLTSEETRIFEKLQSYVLSTTIYSSNAVKHYSNEDTHAPIMYNVGKMQGVANDGQWYADRNDMQVFGGLKNNGMQIRVGYQFFEDPCAADEALCDSDRVPDTRCVRREQNFSSSAFCGSPTPSNYKLATRFALTGRVGSPRSRPRCRSSLWRRWRRSR